MDEIVTWTDERIDQLKKLWDQGLSASVIGKQLGVSKNAVVGKAHRLKLPPRPSPIRKGTRPPVRRMAVLAKPLPAPVSLEPAGAEPAPSAAARLDPPRAAAPAERPRFERGLPGVPPVAQSPRAGAFKPATRKASAGGRSCLWPIGDPGAPDFHFCGAEAVPGKSYCAEHCAKAYITKHRADPEAA